MLFSSSGQRSGERRLWGSALLMLAILGLLALVTYAASGFAA